jgi:hypothetical protein
LRCDALAVTFMLTLLGCASAGRTHAVQRLPKCEARSLPRAAQPWQRTEQGDGFAFFLPPSCIPDTETPRFVHGGSRWRCGTIGVEIVWGMWGAGSFGDHEHQ